MFKIILHRNFFYYFDFGIYAIPKIVERIKNDKVVQGDRLDNQIAVSEGQLLKIGPAPKFELINQDSKKSPMKHTKGKYMC
jgi:protein SCO1/2